MYNTCEELKKLHADALHLALNTHTQYIYALSSKIFIIHILFLFKYRSKKKKMHDTTQTQAASVVSVDMGNLLAFDPRPIDPSELKTNPNEFLSSITKFNTQLLLNQLFNLPVERVEDVIVAKLPKGLTVIPREKPLPKAKPPTKWEQYAKLKGIQKKKKSRMVYDETTKEFRPTWGYKRKDDSTKDWIYEIKKNEDPYHDFFSQKTTARNERVAKNELQRLRNIARTNSKKGKVPGVGLQPLFTEDKKTDKFQVFRNFVKCL